MKKFIKLSIYFVMVITCWFTSQSDNWNTIHEQIIIVTSVIAAAVFVRLNRSLPISATDTFVEGQVRRITESYIVAAKALGVYAAIVITTIAYSILLLTPLNIIFLQWSHFNFLPELLLCLLFGHVLIRSTDIIILDLDFAKLQSDLLSERAKNATELRNQSPHLSISKPLSVPKEYGSVIDDSDEDQKS